MVLKMSVESSENANSNENLRKATIDFLKGMLQEEWTPDTPPTVDLTAPKPSKDYQEGQKFFTDKKAKHKAVLNIDSKSFTTEKILKEIEKNGEYSDMLVKMINDHRIKMSK